MVDYSYQAELVDRVWANLQEHGRCVLAAGCGAGKTVMSADLIARHLADSAAGRVLFLAHGQTELRNQTAASFARDARFTSSEVGTDEFDDEAQVHVAIPHAWRKLDSYTYSLVVVDEAHQLFRGNMVQRILAKNSEARILVLTASHWWFVREKWPVVAYAVEHLLTRGVVLDTCVGMIPTEQEFRHFTVDDGQGRSLSDKEKLQNVAKIVSDIIPFLQSKNLIACHNQEAAREVHANLVSRGRSAVISTSDTDANNIAFREFKQNPGVSTLVVVFRGVLGFDLPELSTVVDLTGTQNIDRMFQLLGRVIRQQEGKKPWYAKLAPESAMELYQHRVEGTVWLICANNYDAWDGSLDGIRMRISNSRLKADGGVEGAIPVLRGQTAEPPRPIFDQILQTMRHGNYGGTGLLWTTVGKTLSAYRVQMDPEYWISRIKAFVDENGHLPRYYRREASAYEKQLALRVRDYTSPGNALYQPEFAAWAHSLGLKRKFDTAGAKEAILQYIKQNGRLPDDQKLRTRYRNYINRANYSYDPSFREAVEVLLGSGTARARVASVRARAAAIVYSVTNTIYASARQAHLNTGVPLSTITACAKCLPKANRKYRGLFRYATEAEERMLDGQESYQLPATSSPDSSSGAPDVSESV